MVDIVEAAGVSLLEAESPFAVPASTLLSAIALGSEAVGSGSSSSESDEWCPGDRIAGVLVAAGASRGDVESVFGVVRNVVPGSGG